MCVGSTKMQYAVITIPKWWLFCKMTYITIIIRWDQVENIFIISNKLDKL